MSRPEYIPLSDAAARAVAGAASRHAALIEDAFNVLIETPGGGVSISGDAKSRAGAKLVVAALAAQADSGGEITEADVRVAIGNARAGTGKSPAGLPSGRRGQVAPRTPGQARYLDALNKCELVFGLGPAGTGKTFLAVAHGAGLLLRGEVDRLIVSRPAVEAGERLGFLPGDLTEKVDPYMAPVWEALTDILGAEQFRRRREKGEIEVAPIAFLRGRTLSHAFVIVDEAQNTTRLQMKMVLTRIGEGSRMAVTGDPSQIDLVNAADSGLAHAVGLLEGVKGVGVNRFAVEDIVRHPMVERIVRAYDADAAKSGRAI
ncbi:phosphate starvation-inducible protein PhoH [Phenylobacterium sp. Root77]|uniref:PhoH family protein n=1 Tax=unclassified Phenylobacterium TaxID=2640670 RepID=UPI0006FBB526|nr:MULTISPECIES: PhoH family protein [unclassified Phenylobacterium]KQW69097.1 phosphate starvation-inducible protein PhoH [Phenylobacterium sp. Root1277]KQW95536.1 phosphate starvation-inducible protein PhoH [Phenylobacterium sp. Root1290]KRC41325.1 phosphate starvation-inducible protein PhoH [Phenylobacterium sp. Root77]